MDNGEDEKRDKEAHIRFTERTNQCILSFLLNYTSEEFGELCSEIQATRQENETVDALLQHTENKIIKILQNRWTERDDAGNECAEDKTERPFPSINLNISLKNKRKHVGGNTVLKALRAMKGLKFSILDNRFTVMVNAPLINFVRLQNIIYSGTEVQPVVFKGHLVEQQSSQHWWYRSKDKTDWTEVGNKYKYSVKPEDVGCFLKFKCLPVNQFGKGAPFEIVTERTVILMPEIPHCPFLDRQRHTPRFLNGDQFRVVSYNTLSSRYTNDSFEYCPMEYLGIDYRKKLLLKELLGYKADIICLQEVDLKVFHGYLNSEFKQVGYGCIYDKKGNRIPEGLALFYNKNRFSCSRGQQVVMYSEIKSNNHLRSLLKLLEIDKATADTFYKQATSMQYCRLKSKNSNQVIIVANTHLYYHPEANNVRLIQAAICLEVLKHLYNKEVRSSKGLIVSMIFCGDFNSHPKSKVFNFLTSGLIQYDGADQTKNCSTTIFHPFQFTSACGTPQYTNYTETFKECLDYIFYDNLSLIQHVPLPEESLLAENIALPSVVFPSDHIALVADFKFK